MSYPEETIRKLKERAIDIREDILEMIPAGKVGHLGGSCSAADIVAALYFEKMHVYPDPKDARRDRCIMSKGHAVLAQYAAFAELGYIDRKEFKGVKTYDGLLQGHPDMRTPGIEAVTGSLGQGLSVSLGMALGVRLDGATEGRIPRVYCILGDGEIAEGQIWEAAMAAVNYKADNLCAVLDLNGIQATAETEAVFPIHDLREKWAGFGWHVIEIDGHDMEAVLAAFDEAEDTKGVPTILIAKTVKGKGFDFAEGRPKYHNGSLTEAEYVRAKECIAAMRAAL